MPNDKMIGEWCIRICQGVAVAEFKVIYRHLPGSSKWNQRNVCVKMVCHWANI